MDTDESLETLMDELPEISPHGISGGDFHDTSTLTEEERGFEFNRREEVIREQNHKLELNDVKFACQKAKYESSIEREKQKNHEKDTLLKQREDEHSLRKFYLACVFWFVVVYLLAIVVLLYLCACKWLHLSDAVLMMVLGTTTADVLGLLYIAFKWLFPKRSD